MAGSTVEELSQGRLDVGFRLDCGRREGRDGCLQTIYERAFGAALAAGQSSINRAVDCGSLDADRLGHGNGFHAALFLRH